MNDDFLNKHSVEFWDIVADLILKFLHKLRLWSVLPMTAANGDHSIAIWNPRFLNTDLSQAPTFYH